MKGLEYNFRIKGLMRAVLLAIMAFMPVNTVFTTTPCPVPTESPAVKTNVIDGGIFEECTLCSKESAESDKKITRKAHLVTYPNAEATIVMCHGFMCDKYDIAFLRRLFPRGKFNVLTFDFRGHGEDRGSQQCTFGKDEVYDVEAAVHYVRNRDDLKNLPCIAYGFSMGAVSAIEAQSRNQSLFDAMILDCPFDSSENVIKRGLDGLKVSAFGYEFNMPGRELLQKYAFHPHVQAFVKNVLRCITALNPHDIDINMCRVYPGESIKKVSVPCLFITCKNDEKIDVESVKNVYNNAASQYKILRITDGKAHFGSYFYVPEQYTQWVREFLMNVLNGDAQKTSLKEIIEH